ncbi:MAG: 23S rRNA (uracil(1939)-C(5))-methyltransferase RlmD [Bacteroidales bacterium]
MGRKKSLPVLEKVLITDIGSEGNAIARVDNMVVFVPMLVPGDIVDIRVIRKRKRYMEGTAIHFHTYSSLRQDPTCEHFGICGGCKWQHLPYTEQLKWKEQQVRDNLRRIGHIDIPELNPIIGSDDKFFYRNKLEYTFSDKRWLTKEEISTGAEIEKGSALGFHIPGLFDKVLNIDYCHLQPEPTNAIRNAVRVYSVEKGLEFYNLREHTGFLRNLVVRNTISGEVMVVVVFAREDRERREELLNFIKDTFPRVTSLMYMINGKKNDSTGDIDALPYYGNDHIIETMEGLKFRIGPKSFYQTSTRQGARLYSIVKDFASLKGGEVVYDLYTGTGTIACYLASAASKVIGIEYVSEAVEDARNNALMNNIENTFFFAGDMKDVLCEQFFSENGRPDVLVTDPPRAGMHEDVIGAIIRSAPSKIVYVSCNPATQARDLGLLDQYYLIKEVQPVDMFPHTHHVENVVLLNRR